jgi:CO/xanthine dehydrogenase FAD-binding subunit
MRSDASLYDLTAPASLDEALRTLAEAPGLHTLIAGGTELMVALGAGRLSQTSLLSLHRLGELRFIEDRGDVIAIGSGTTFSDLRRSSLIADAFPLLARSASWTGSVANQNRATLGGNICNGSPAADTPPVLLAYGASVTLFSAAGDRTVAYADFHLGYKRTVLQPTELLHTVLIPRTHAEARQYLRKVGTRNAQSISKVALAAVAQVDGNVITEMKLGAASLTDRPIRLLATEQTLHGQTLTDELIHSARATLAGEVKPIDDIRSTGKYRRAVAGNLLEEFLRSLTTAG